MIRIAHIGLLAVALLGCRHAQAAQTPPPQHGAPLPPAEALFARGLQLAREGDAVRAEQYLLLALRAGTPHERVIVPLVRVCIASARLRSALAHAEPFLRRHPQAWQLRYLTAAIHLALGRPGAALIELQRVLAARPHAAQAHYLLGVTLRDAFRDASAARASFEAYLASEPRGIHAPEVLAWLGEQRRGDAVDASAAPLAPAPEAP